MGDNYFVVYAEANLVCTILFSILLAHDMRRPIRPEAQQVFDWALMAHIAYFISDIIWAAEIAGVFPRMRWLVAAVSLSNFIFLGSLALFWFFYVAATMDLPLRKTKRGLWLIRAPFCIMLAVLVIAYLSSPAYWISPDLELNFLYYPLMLAVPLVYLLASLFYSLYRAGKTANPEERRSFLFTGLYPTTVVAIGIVQTTLVKDIPLFCYGCAIMMVIFYIHSMEDQISLDPLTKLNNRGQLQRFVAQPGNLYREGQETYVVMMDANFFKQINDSYGHAEGDRALLFIAEALKRSLHVLGSAPFLGRYGGDEFILIAYVRREEDLNALAEEIRRRLDEAREKEGLPYVLSVGIGWSRFAGEGDTFQACMHRADQQLYEDKAREKQRIRRRMEGAS